MGEIKIAVAGVGNLCSALVQGVNYYKDGEAEGLINKKLGDYSVGDIKFVAAFDIDMNKIGLDLSEAIFAEPNASPKFLQVPDMGLEVEMGPAPDEVQEESMSELVRADVEASDPVKVLRESRADILVNMISGGSERGSKIYAEACLEAGCAYLNATPALVVSEKEWDSKFRESGIPMAGDDLLDQVGATAVHMGLLEFLNLRGVKVGESYQLDVGGGTESINTLERTRERKRKLKTRTVSRAVPYSFPLISGSMDFVDFLGNSRDSFFWIKGSYYCGAPFTMDVKLNTIDSTNGGAVLLDTIRALKISKDRGLAGAIKPICDYGFKTGCQSSLVESLKEFRGFVKGR
ncbi:MAG: inositol-3-phosphate synthase [Candidatus Bathyarchaeia archaeon]